MSTKKGCAFGLMLGSLLKAFVTLLGAVSKVLGVLLWYTGTWVPGVYALFGVVLYLVWHFNPFESGIYPLLYKIGFVLCAVICIVLLIRNLIVKPFRSVAEGYRNPVWHKSKEEEEPDKKKEGEKSESQKLLKYRRRSVRRAARRKARLMATEGAAARSTEGDGDLTQNDSSGYLDDLYGYRNLRLAAEQEEREAEERAAKEEQPKIYLSAVEKDTLIHEYSDRFEVYDLDRGKKTLRGIEYKGERH